ncbi:ABC transporter ATP-binding protein [Acidisoma cellulosilytica]|uniref:ABC transporter ATP-binding protein n=1 Tax=Acidisoma cellulosilyticum TaxID=2802395 RepID=A0A963Z2K7_9PROT|nr:ABC transporter ATP-binding protein [Acidisoma cellulosilyticum]MCB8881351.1 ABC transporter ATP-binding protein [Acidisoma cellulosilyticum]
MANAVQDIQIRHLSRRFTRADGQTVTALDDLSVTIKAGEFVCLVGPSGCGKTTLLQMLAGLLRQSSGEIEAQGKPVLRPGPERGVVFQKDSVFPWMRVIDNVEYGLKCRGVSKGERRERALHYLERVGLMQVAQAWPKELSGGMLKRVAIATVFANGAEILMLDEPFGALDYVTRHQLHDVLLDLWLDGEGGRRRTVIFVTHDVDEALILADRILVFHSGRMVEDLAVTLPKPRSADDLVLPELVNHRHRLLQHMGLIRPAAAKPGQ